MQKLEESLLKIGIQETDLKNANMTISNKYLAYTKAKQAMDAAADCFIKDKGEFEESFNNLPVSNDIVRVVIEELAQCAVAIANLCEDCLDSNQQKYRYSAQTAYYYEQAVNLLERLQPEQQEIKAHYQLKASLFYYILGMKETSKQITESFVTDKSKRLPEYRELFKTDDILAFYQQVITSIELRRLTQNSSASIPLHHSSPIFAQQYNTSISNEIINNDESALLTKSP